MSIDVARFHMGWRVLGKKKEGIYFIFADFLNK
jgi:hypothetical protein